MVIFRNITHLSLETWTHWLHFSKVHATKLNYQLNCSFMNFITLPNWPQSIRNLSDINEVILWKHIEVSINLTKQSSCLGIAKVTTIRPIVNKIGIFTTQQFFSRRSLNFRSPCEKHFLCGLFCCEFSDYRCLCFFMPK